MHAIGGYFELELSKHSQFFTSNTLNFQSARAALVALLQFSTPKKIWLPHFICNAMLEAVKECQIEACFYSINDQFGIEENLSPAPDDFLLYVNYFGICSQQINKILNRFDPKKIIIDNSQAFFSPPSECLANIYSPRKFFGVPDGGIIITNLPLTPPDTFDIGSIARMRHLLMRVNHSPEEGYPHFYAAEKSLSDLQPKRMSRLTSSLLANINYRQAYIQREENFGFLHKNLESINSFKIPYFLGAPLCYPFITNKTTLRENLRKRRIYTPTYWPDVIPRVNPNTLEYSIVQQLIPLPCDQRYTLFDMKRIIEAINE